MFHVVGWLPDYSFVYDTEDSSCELISSSLLNGVVYKKGFVGKLPLYKLCMLLNIPQFENYVLCDTLSIWLEGVKSSFVPHLVIIKSDVMFAKDGYKSTCAQIYDKYGFNTDYFVFLCTVYSNKNSNMLHSLRLKDTAKHKKVLSVGDSLLIPPIMLPYLLKLITSMDIRHLKLALFDFLFDSCVFNNYSNQKWYGVWRPF